MTIAAGQRIALDMVLVPGQEPIADRDTLTIVPEAPPTDAVTVDDVVSRGLEGRLSVTGCPDRQGRW